ncbi:sensor histidine kinase [Massilia sp. PWRC2]|uniref:sensor histidine kinase n=1 Tax=Massilia sp. PWRC2 TaxID=2804626 RepID=UPI003CEF5D2C
MTLSHRCALLAIALMVSLAPVGITLLGLWPGVQPALSMALTALALAGLLFHGLLVRHLGTTDTLAQLRERLAAGQLGRARAEQALASTRDELWRALQQHEQVRENERQRIARDIHDDLGQHLLALKIEVQLARHAAIGAPATHTAATLERLARHVDQTIDALRVVIDNLRPLALDGGLRAAMEQHLREFSRLHGIGYQLVTGADHGGGGDGLDVVLLRILRESLANVVRHAQASQVWVALSRGDTSVTLEIRDNGIGMAPPAADTEDRDGNGIGSGGGCGLAGIADRVAAAGGSFDIDSGPGAGTVLSMSIPLPGR